jgi:hypothetical protein
MCRSVLIVFNLAFAPLAFAHHGAGTFDVNSSVELTGTITGSTSM